LPMAKSQWFNRLWNIADGVTPMPVNLKFEQTDGSKRSIMMGCMLFALGDENVRALHNLEERVR